MEYTARIGNETNKIRDIFIVNKIKKKFFFWSRKRIVFRLFKGCKFNKTSVVRHFDYVKKKILKNPIFLR